MPVLELNQVNICKLQEIIKIGLCSGTGGGKAGDVCVEQAIALVFEDNGKTDAPKCVHPVLRGFSIRLNDCQWSSPEARANGLRRLALAQLGTAENFDGKLFVEKMVAYAINNRLPHALIALGKVFPKEAEVLGVHAQACRNAKTFANMRTAAEAAKDTTWKIRTDAYAAAYAYAAAAAYADADADAAAYAYADAAAYAAAYADAAAAAYADAYAAAYKTKFLAEYNAKKAEYRDKALCETAEYAVQVLIEMKTPGSEFLDLAC